MKRSEFPEKAYESLFIHELLVHFSKPNSTPLYIPSQVVEKGLAFDACFVDNSGNPLKRKVMLLQFKTSSKYEGKNRKWDFKFDIYKGHGERIYQQHNKLCKYNKMNRKISGVYCAPLFVTYTDFFREIKNSSIIADSLLFIPVSRLRKGNHSIKYMLNGQAKQFSEEGQELETHSFETVLQNLDPISKETFCSVLSTIQKEKLETELKDDCIYDFSSNTYFLFI